MSFNVNVSPVSSDVDFINPDPADTTGPIIPQEEMGVGGAGEGLPGRGGGGEVVANVIVPSDKPGDLLGGATNMQVLSLEDYHWENGKGNVIRNDWPSVGIDFVVVGGYIAPLTKFMSAQHGLESISISYGSQGLQTSFRFATRYPTPVPDQMIQQRVEPQLNLNVFGRTF